MTDEYKDYWKNGRYGCGIPMLAVFVFAVVMLFSSCATRTRIEYRDRDVNHYITNVVHDTLIDKSTDSVYVYVTTKGDTIYQNVYRERTRWRDRIVEKHDTCWRDSVVTEYVEKDREIIKIPKIFWLTFVFSIIIIIFALIKFLRWLRLN